MLEKVKNLLDFEEWLDNDCGGCETCDRIFDKSDYNHRDRMIASLSQKEMLEYTEFKSSELGER